MRERKRSEIKVKMKEREMLSEWKIVRKRDFQRRRIEWAMYLLCLGRVGSVRGLRKFAEILEKQAWRTLIGNGRCKQEWETR